MVVRPRFAVAAVAGLVLLPLAACTDSSGGRGSQAGGLSSRPPSSPGSTSSASTAPTSTSAASTSPAPAPAPTASVPGPMTSPRDPSTPIPPVATPVPSGNAVLGPSGWQTLLLGMSLADAQATGIFVDTPDPGATGCADWYAVNAAAIDSVTVSGGRGAVVAITVTSSDKVIATPEGMALGWSAAQVHEAYPSWPPGAEDSLVGPPTIAVPQNPDAVYRVQLQVESVIALTLESRTQDCYD